MSYRITLTPSTFSTDDPIILARAAESQVADVSRRVTRTATLDGGAVISDMGFAHGDRTLTVVQTAATPAEIEAARYLCQTYPLAVAATWSGVFLGALESVRVDGGDLLISFLVSSCLSEV